MCLHRGQLSTAATRKTGIDHPDLGRGLLLPPVLLQNMKILVACEYSGAVRDELTARGHDATSCDILPSETPGQHYQGNVLNILNDEWDMMIAFPPCTHLARSGGRWWPEKRADGRQQEAINFFLSLAHAPIPRIAIENPVGIMSTVWRKPNQVIQPWQFGHGELKTTCLWLKNLPTLKPTKIVEGREQRMWKMPPSPDRAKERSRTYPGIAKAMAEQWTRPFPLRLRLI